MRGWKNWLEENELAGGPVAWFNRMANVTRVESGSAGRQLAQFAEAELVGVDFTLKLDKK